MQEQIETLAFSDTGTVEGYRLSPQQRRLWGALGGERAERQSAQAALSVAGADAARLRRALEEVCRRHEALRTAFGRLAGMRHPLQVIAEECGVRWREAGRVADLAELLREERERASAGGAATFGGCVAEVEGVGAVLALTAPALCCDLRSLVNVAREVAASLGGGEGAGDEDEVVQYVQFSEWQNELAEGEGGEAGRAFWREALERFGAQGELRLGLEAAPGGEFVWGEVSTSLPAEEVTRGLGAGEEEVLLSCWVALLGRLGGRSSVPVSVLLHGRSFEEMESAVGLYASWAPLNGDVQPDFTYTELLGQVGQTLLEAYEWQECYAASEQDGPLDSETSSSSHRIGYEYVEWPNVEGPAGGTLRPLQVSPPAEPFKLCLRALRTGSELRLTLHHDAAQVDAGWARLLLGQYETLLRSCLADPSAPLSRHDALSQSEREDAFSQLARNSRPYPRTPLLPELIAGASREQPEAEAVVDGARTVTRARMWRAAGRVAGMLRASGVVSGDRVGLLAGRSAEAVAGLLGCWRLGAAYVPLDGSQPGARLESMLDDCGAKAVLVSGESSPLPVGGRAVLDLGAAGLFDDAGDVDDEAGEAVEGGDIAYLIYTSGTTGRPKGVAVTHGSLLNLLHALDESVYSQASASRVSVNAPLWFDASVKQLVQLGLGRSLVIVPEEVRADAEALTEWVISSGVEAFDCTPSHLRALLGAGLRRRCEESGAGLRHLLIGGEAVDETLWAELGDWQGVTSHNLYGPTECTVDVTHRVISREDAPTLGLPLANVEAYVLDGQGRLCPSGVAGELCAGGAGVAVGYWGDARRTAERFVPDAYSGRAGARLYRTGDVARRGADGRLSYEGRADGQVKVRGFRIELGEVEAGLRQVSWVSEAAAAVVGEGDAARLVGYVVAHSTCEGAECGHEIVGAREYVGRLLPEYMVPAQVVMLDSLPLTTNGKLDRRALPAPEAMRRRERTAPRTETESALHDIWCEVLGLDAVSVDESFFELGGHSLVATRVMSRVREGMGAEVPLRRLFEAVTIEKLALAVDEARSRGAERREPALTRIDRSRFRAAEADAEGTAG